MAARDEVERNVRAVAIAIEKARAAWDGWNTRASAWLGIAERDQVIAAIASRERSALSLAATGRRLADAGASQAKLDAWTKTMRELVAGLVTDAGEAASVSLSRVIADTASATATDVKDGVVAIANWVRPVLMVVGVAVIIYLVRR